MINRTPGPCEFCGENVEAFQGCIRFEPAGFGLKKPVRCHLGCAPDIEDEGWDPADAPDVGDQ